MIALMIHKHLRFIFKTAEGGGMDDAVAVALETAARIALRLSKKPPTAFFGRTRVHCRGLVLHIGHETHYIRLMEQSNEPFTMTPAAAKRIAYLLSDEPEGTAFVVSVLGGGCSGFQYHFDLKTKPAEEGDLALEDSGAKVIVDSVSLNLLKGSWLDYEDDLASAGFVIKNPNATAKCGCGNSFSVAL